MRKICLLTSSIFFSSICFSQVGSIKGIIKDAKTQEPIIGATVLVEGTSLGAATGIEGDFNIAKVPVGQYTVVISSVSYTSKKLEGLTVKAETASVLNTTLSEEALELEGVTVQATKLTSTDVSLVIEIKEAKTIVSAISGAQIAKTQDRDAAEVVRRIPGVTLFDNRFILVRGLNDRYNSVWLNDASSPSTEADKKSFSFDIIPTAVIDRILVFKNPSPELPGDFAGGMVKIYTKTSLPTNDFNVSFSAGYRAGSTFENFNYNTRSATDFLGFDNGDRSIPIANRIGVNLVDEQAAAKLFKNTWAINKTTALPDFRFSLTKGSSFSIAKQNIESVSLLNYSNTNTIYSIDRADSDPEFLATDNQSTNQVRLGAMQNFGIRLNERNKIEWRNLFNQIGSDQTVIRIGKLTTSAENSFFEQYQSRWILTSQISGKHSTVGGKGEYNWTLGYSHTNRNDPDLKRVSYFKDPSGTQPFSAPIQPGSADTRYGGRFFQNLIENVYSFSHGYTKKIDIRSKRLEFSAGNFIELRSRDFTARSLGYILPPGSSANDQSLKQLPLDQIFAPQNVGKGGFIINEITDGSDGYQADNTLVATYASLNIPLGNKIKLIGGARGEYNIQSLKSEVNLVPTNPSIKTFNVLPSANISYNFTDKSLIRVAYGRSVNRPEFREWAPFKFYDFNFNVNVYGSLFPTVLSGGQPLKISTIDNIDIRYEFYPSPNELFHIGVFYKNFINPIEQYILPGSNRTYTFANAQSAFVQGVEFDLRKNLEFISESLFRNMSLVANASLIKSEIQVGNSIGQQTVRPLQGQSDYVVNAGFYYQNEDTGLSGSLTYNVFGPRIFLVGSLDYPSYGELPRNTIDFAISYPLSKRASLTFAAQDLLNQPVQLVQDINLDGKFDRDPDLNSPNHDLTIQKFRKGRYFNFGIKFNL